MKHFTLSEFDSPDVLGSGECMNQHMLDKLDRARGLADLPFHVTSGYRTIEHNAKVGGVEDSAHLSGHAADIAIKHLSDEDTTRVIAALAIAGFRRIGKADTYVHVDDDPGKPLGNGLMTWGYD